jgi:hypothetical protein
MSPEGVEKVQEMSAYEMSGMEISKNLDYGYSNRLWFGNKEVEHSTHYTKTEGFNTAPCSRKAIMMKYFFCKNSFKFFATFTPATAVVAGLEP